MKTALTSNLNALTVTTCCVGGCRHDAHTFTFVFLSGLVLYSRDIALSPDESLGTKILQCGLH